MLCLAAPGAGGSSAAARGVAPSAPVRSDFAVGIADQKAAFFDDPRFTALDIHYARRAVSWDALTSDWQRAELDQWMAKAQAAGVAPLLTMEHSRLAGQTKVLPTPDQLVEQFRALRARYPWVTDFSAWNEANCRCQATWNKPALVATYWKRMRADCPDCRVLGADLVDVDGMIEWTKRFLRAAGRQPAYWGVHNYVSANNFSTQSTVDLLKATTGEIWFTETGGVVARRSKYSHAKIPQGVGHAADTIRFILQTLAGLSPRVTRAYFYQWNSSSGTDSWDSSFVAANGTVRPSLDVVKQFLAGHPGPPPPVIPAPVPPVAPALDADAAQAADGQQPQTHEEAGHREEGRPGVRPGHPGDEALANALEHVGDGVDVGDLAQPRLEQLLRRI